MLLVCVVSGVSCGWLVGRCLVVVQAVLVLVVMQISNPLASSAVSVSTSLVSLVCSTSQRSMWLAGGCMCVQRVLCSLPLAACRSL